MQNDTQVKKSLSLVDFATFGLPSIIAIINIVFTVLTVGPGFPLDDAWIHQTFARNFTETGSWAFQAGSNAGGSTSPLWTLILATGYWIKGFQPYVLTFALGSILFALLVWIGKQCVESMDGNRKGLSWFWLLAAATSWQLVWAAGSGMETILYSVLIMGVFYMVIAQGKGWIWMAGILTGVGVWIRPDAVTLAGPIVLVLMLKEGKFQKRLFETGIYLLAMVVPLAGYLAWNLAVSGEIFPNTFYAKQAEYAVMLNAPITTRLLNMFLPLFAGVGILLLPGMIYAAWKSFIEHKFSLAAIFIWCLGYGLVYALRLPVNYQHGRYMMPVLAPLLLLGVVGTYDLIRKLAGNKGRISWVMVRVWAISIVLVAAAFLVRGIGQYREDVKAINQLMVASAQWIAVNTQADDLIAVHDIGAAGYFGNRRILDLAGLVNPEIIPIIRNETALGEYLTEQKADYLVVLKDWYPMLETTGTQVAQFDYTDGMTNEMMLIRKLKK